MIWYCFLFPICWASSSYNLNANVTPSPIGSMLILTRASLRSFSLRWWMLWVAKSSFLGFSTFPPQRTYWKKEMSCTSFVLICSLDHKWSFGKGPAYFLEINITHCISDFQWYLTWSSHKQVGLGVHRIVWLHFYCKLEAKINKLKTHN